MIVPVDCEKCSEFITMALREGVPVFARDVEGFHRLTTPAELEGRPLGVDLEFFADAYALAQHFDLALGHQGGRGIVLTVSPFGKSHLTGVAP